MCAPGMESVDEELNAVLQGHQLDPTHASLAGVVSGVSSAAASLAGGGGGAGGRSFVEGQQSFSSELPQAMLGPGASRTYNDSSSLKSSSMSAQTINPYQDQGGGNNFGPSTPIAPKNGMRRQGLWSGGNRNYMNGGRNGEEDIDPRLHVSDYSSALLDQHTIAMPDPFRPSGGGLSRYHSAPSSFLASLAADFQQDSALTFFSDADLPPLNPPSESSIDNMDTEQASSPLFDDKFLLDTRKFERRGTTQGLGGVPGGGGGLVSQKSLQSSFKPSMEVVLENSQVVAPQMPSTPQISSSSQMASSMASTLGMPSTIGLVQQQISNPQGGQQLSPLANINLTGNISFSTGLGSDFISNGPQGVLGSPLNSVRPNNLLRQSSSPAGLLAQLTIDVQGQMPKSEKQSLSSPAAQSPEDSLSGGTSEENLGTGMISGMDVAGWEDAANSYLNSWGNDTFSARKRFRDNMDLGDIIVSSETSGRGTAIDHGPAPGSLTRHMSLPTPKSKAVLPDDILQSVPCRIRAKRGCATHPRSIAERVRRTRISERMRKLQELVPNMDKQQTNTADMLDEAVEYVKQLQRQVQELTETQAKCNGSCHQDNKASAT